MGEVARALEVNPNVLHRWRREIREGPGNVFPGHGKQRWAEGAHCRVGAQDRPAGSGNRFFEEVLAAHRGTADAAGVDWKSARSHQKGPGRSEDRKWTNCRMMHGEAGPGFPVQLLPPRWQRELGPDPDMDLRDGDPEDLRWSAVQLRASAHEATRERSA